MYRIIITVSILLTNFLLVAQDSLQDILNKGEKPSIHNIYQDITDANNNHSSIPISIIQGKKQGAYLQSFQEFTDLNIHQFLLLNN